MSPEGAPLGGAVALWAVGGTFVSKLQKPTCNSCFIPFLSDFEFHLSSSCEVTVMGPHFTLSSVYRAGGSLTLLPSAVHRHRPGCETVPVVLGVGKQPEVAERRRRRASGILRVPLSWLNMSSLSGHSCLFALGTQF